MNYKWQFSIAMLNYQRVDIIFWWSTPHEAGLRTFLHLVALRQQPFCVRLDVCCAQEGRNEKPAVATTLIYGIYNYSAGQMVRTNFGKFPKKIDSRANRT